MITQAQRALGQADIDARLDQGLRGILAAAVASGVCDMAGVTERVGDELSTVGATDDLVNRLDALQYDLRQGPCVQASYQDGALTSHDVSGDERWPIWGPAAARAGVGAVLSVHLYTERDSMGALNLYVTGSRTFGHDDLETAKFIASTVSVTLAGHRQSEHLWAAIDARHRVGAAQGILVGKYDISMDQAFEVLRRLSSHHELKLSAIATRIVAHRGIPPEFRD
ncbi:ANTAR domain protein (plasmid) [Variovorax sp. PBS-H4]|uniref:GAF and ANTAR domain-containing protein n=1 Tax=Variovorax sp. PBS-H4 TaxID=434008 RepID=UPI00131639BB|nr:GAF and ANTAR domain-containing protein [Variovorax sp. PBS-H4]VTU41508.1 ANTAR domain protein [Variovorax sp. PBS-H4]